MRTVTPRRRDTSTVARRAFAAFLVALFVATSAATPALAQPGTLNRCVAADGTAVFTDRACDAVDARPAPTPQPNPDSLPDGAVTVRECPRRPKALVEAIEQAFAAADGNKLAELYDWRGRSSAAANAVMPRLERLAASPVIEVRTGHSAEASADPELAAEAAKAPPDRLLITRADDGMGHREVVEFRLVRAAGCWWIAD